MRSLRHFADMTRSPCAEQGMEVFISGPCLQAIRAQQFPVLLEESHSLERRTSSKRAPTRAARLRCADTSRPKAPSRPARSPISRLIRRMTNRLIPRSISSAASKRTRPTRRTPRRRSRTRSRYRPRNTGGPKAIEACSDRLPYPRSSQQTLFGASFDYRDGH